MVRVVVGIVTNLLARHHTLYGARAEHARYQVGEQAVLSVKCRPGVGEVGFECVEWVTGGVAGCGRLLPQRHAQQRACAYHPRSRSRGSPQHGFGVAARDAGVAASRICRLEVLFIKVLWSGGEICLVFASLFLIVSCMHLSHWCLVSILLFACLLNFSPVIRFSAFVVLHMVTIGLTHVLDR